MVAERFGGVRFEQNGLSIDWRQMRIWRDDSPIDLSNTEFKLLYALVRQQGSVVSHEQLMAEVWAPTASDTARTCKLYIWYLRRKIERDPSRPEFIQTRHGIGYIFSDPDPLPPTGRSRAGSHAYLQ